MTHPSAADTAGLTPEMALEVWRRRKSIGLVAFVLVLTGAVSAALSLPDLYHATATVLVERQQVSEAFVRPSVTAELETRIQTIQQQVMSRSRLAEVITRLGLYPTLRDVVPMDALVERMRNEVRLDLRGAPQSSGRTATIAFALGYSGRDPATVAQVANTLAALYVEENAASRERQATLTADFLKRQLAEVEQELDEHDRRIGDFKSLHSGELLQQVEVNLAALDRLNTQLRLNADNQMRLLERRERLDQQRARDESGAADPESPAANLLKLKKELAELRRTYTDDYPDVVRLRADVAAAEREVAAAAARAAATGDPALQRAQESIGDTNRELAALKTEEEFLRRTIGQYEARVENAPRRQQDLQQLSRNYELSKERYQSLLKRFEEAQLAEHLEEGQNVEQFRVLDAAVAPTRPVAPNREWLLLMGVLAAFAAGVAAIVLAEKLDTTFHDADELQGFAGLPLLATIRHIRTQAGTRRRRRRFALVAVATAAGLAIVAAGSYYVVAGNEQLTLITARPGT